MVLFSYVPDFVCFLSFAWLSYIVISNLMGIIFSVIFRVFSRVLNSLMINLMTSMGLWDFLVKDVCVE